MIFFSLVRLQRI